MTAPVSITKVSRTFGNHQALDHVSLDIAAGEFIVLLGPSGCGKTTLLSILGGFLSPTTGQIVIGGRDMTGVPPARRPTTTMFQDYALFPHMRLDDNVGFGLRMRGTGKAAARVKALDFLDLVGLKPSAAKKPHQLSGGQRQRVALARALAVDPDVLLLDEPLGALDLKLRRQMQDELKAIQKRIGTTFVHVTHDQEEAMAIADRIVVMNQGRIADVGTPAEIYLRPRSLFSAGFMGEANFIPGTIATLDSRQALVETALGLLPLDRPRFIAEPAVGQRVVLCLRPEHLGPSGETAPDRLTLGMAIVTATAFFGPHHRCHVRLVKAPAVTLIAHLPQSAEVAEGRGIALCCTLATVVALPATAASGES